VSETAGDSTLGLAAAGTGLAGVGLAGVWDASLSAMLMVESVDEEAMTTALISAVRVRVAGSEPWRRLLI
jgi:hypothetical protein